MFCLNMSLIPNILNTVLASVAIIISVFTFYRTKKHERNLIKINKDICFINELRYKISKVHYNINKIFILTSNSSGLMTVNEKEVMNLENQIIVIYNFAFMYGKQDLLQKETENLKDILKAIKENKTFQYYEYENLIFDISYEFEKIIKKMVKFENSLYK